MKYTDSKLDPDRFSRKNKNTTPTEKKPSFRASQEVSLPASKGGSNEKKPSKFETQDSYFKKYAKPTSKGGPNRAAQDLPEKKPVVKATVKKTVTSRGPSAGQKEADRLMEKYNTPRGVDPKYIKGR